MSVKAVCPLQRRNCPCIAAELNAIPSYQDSYYCPQGHILSTLINKAISSSHFIKKTGHQHHDPIHHSVMLCLTLSLFPTLLMPSANITLYNTFSKPVLSLTDITHCLLVYAVNFTDMSNRNTRF